MEYSLVALRTFNNPNTLGYLACSVTLAELDLHRYFGSKDLMTSLAMAICLRAYPFRMTNRSSYNVPVGYLTDTCDAVMVQY